MILRVAGLNLEIRENPQLLSEKSIYSSFSLDNCYSNDILIQAERMKPDELNKFILDKEKSGSLVDEKLLNHMMDFGIRFNIVPFFIKKDFIEKKVHIAYSNLFFDHNAKRKYLPDIIISNYSYLIAQMMVPYDRLMLHGAALIRNNFAYIFLAADGGGKSTLINKNDMFFSLSDDQVVYSIDYSGLLTAWSTPFGRICDGNLSAPVKGFFYIVKNKCFELERASSTSLIQSLWNDNKEMLDSLPHKLKKQAFLLIHRISRTVPCYSMKCCHGNVNWSIVDRILEDSTMPSISNLPL